MTHTRDAAGMVRQSVAYPDSVRVGAVQYLQRQVTSFEEFIAGVSHFVRVLADYQADFAVFPEIFTLQLLSMESRQLSPAEAVDALAAYTPRFKQAMQALAVRHHINIIGGSHLTRVESGRVENVCFVFLRDGTIHEQAKIHVTPSEAATWQAQGGRSLRAIQTDCGPIGVLICYDAEFPELARHLTEQGIHTLFVPFCTDERLGYLRVRYCSQARAVENQIYVALSGNVGNLPNVVNMDVQYAQSCILTPCDFAFARDGIAAETTFNVESLAIADLKPEALTLARERGTVRNWHDRRTELYTLQWLGE